MEKIREEDLMLCDGGNLLVLISNIILNFRILKLKNSIIRRFS